MARRRETSGLILREIELETMSLQEESDQLRKLEEFVTEDRQSGILTSAFALLRKEEKEDLIRLVGDECLVRVRQQDVNGAGAARSFPHQHGVGP
jgi:hypothetical protein